MAKFRTAMEKLQKDSVGDNYSGYTLTTTDLVEDNTVEMHRTDKQTFTLRNNNTKKKIVDLDLDELLELAHDIDRSTYFGKYRDIIGDEEWLALYDYRRKPVAAKFGANWSTPMTKVIPCYYCGLALPLELIEVDHWCEKENRDSGRVQAVLKVFRAIGNGLTVGQATGRKGSQSGAIMTGGVITPVATRNAGPALANYNLNAVRDRFDVNKRNLSNDGQLALTALYVAMHPISDEDFFRYFLNNFFNLVPACGSCNKAKNNR
jgi:hypothetical protein